MKGQVGDIGKHIHHEQLVEIYTEPQESREAYIRFCKPEGEHLTRLRLIGVIPDQYLPQEVLAAREIFRQARATYSQAWAVYNQAGAAYSQAWAAHDQAWAADDQAWAAYDQARAALAAYNQARVAYDQALAAYDQASAACNQASAAYDQAIWNNKEHFEATHHLWCEPDCPWNGKTIFPN